MKTIFESDGWEEVSVKSDSLTVYKKYVKGVDIPVFKATALTHIDMDGILESILDADGQDEFLENSHLVESTLIDYSIKDTTFLYQILDLPIISNRHYITKNYTDTVSLSHFRLNWMIDSDQNYRLFKNIIDEKGDKTIVIVSHNKSNLSFCNNRYEIKDGKIEFYLPNDKSYLPRQKIPPYYYRNGICYAISRQKLLDENL